MLDVAIDFRDQFLDAAKGSSANRLLGDAIEPDLHLIEPGGVGWSEVHVKSWPSGEPAFDSCMLVSDVVVHDEVHLQILWHVVVDLAEKAQIFLMPVVRPTAREHFAVRRVQRRKQRRGSVTPVIVRHALDVPSSHWQHRLRAFQRLNAAFFINTQNHCIFWGIQIQPYNIPYFFYKKRIARELELFLPVRLQAKRLPDAMHRRFRYPGLRGNLPDTPMSSDFRFRFQRFAN